MKNPMVEEEDIVQEVYYNLGRAMSECEMQHLAVDNYNSALHVQDDYDFLHDSNIFMLVDIRILL
jgi:hypothetical protein